MTARTSMLHVWVNDDVKEQATHALTAMGLSMSDAVRLLLRRVVIDQALPLELKVPNVQTRIALIESRRDGQPSCPFCNQQRSVCRS